MGNHVHILSEDTSATSSNFYHEIFAKINKDKPNLLLPFQKKFPDAQVRSDICVGGAIRYDLVVWSSLNDCWVLENEVPNISQDHYCIKAAAV